MHKYDPDNPKNSTENYPVERKNITYKVDKSVKGKEWDILSRYIQGQTVEEIASEFGCRRIKIVNFVSETYNGLKEIRELKALIAAQDADAKRNSNASSLFKKTLALNESSKTKDSFLKLLSEPDSSYLTDQEMIFCNLLVYEGNEEKALASSGLTAGLSNKLKNYKQLITLRLIYLKNKPNLNSYLKELREQHVRQTCLDKDGLESVILQQISLLSKNTDNKSAATIAKFIDQLGKMKGLFVEKHINVTSPLDDALAEMLVRRNNESNDEVIDVDYDEVVNDE